MATTPQYRKKLIEVALPLEAINKESAREKSIRHGHPSTLHLWWARRPLAACRAVLFASLVDDPSAWPNLFPTEEKQKSERERIFKIIEEFVIWDKSNNPDVLLKVHSEIARSISRGLGEKMPVGAAAIRKYIAEKAPPVLDPFCGGGSIPFEAQRLGLEAHGSDLNPIPVLITKALIEIPSVFAGKPPVNPRAQKTIGVEWEGTKGLAEDVRYYGEWMRNEAEKRIGKLYPKVFVTEQMAKDRPDLKPYVGKELKVIAWLWARTVSSPNPAVNGAHVPLVRSFWLSTKKGTEAWVEPRINRQSNTYDFDVRLGLPPSDKKKMVDSGTKIGRGCKFKCIISDEAIPDSHVKSEGMADRLDYRLLAIVAEGQKGRIYLSPLPSHESLISKIKNPEDLTGVNSPIAEEKRAIWCYLYGCTTFDKLFTPRQLVALTTFASLVREARDNVIKDASATGSFSTDKQTLDSGGKGATAYADAVAVYLGFAVSRLADTQSSLCIWSSSANQSIHVFGRQALPMVWDFSEANAFGGMAGDIGVTIHNMIKVIDRINPKNVGFVKQLDATEVINGVNAPIISTDPPYYDNIGYADLSDFFYVWLRQSLNSVYPSLFATVLTPKKQELIASAHRHNGNVEAAMNFFENGLGAAFIRMNNIQNEAYPLTVYYAFKQAETEEEGGESDSTLKITVSTGWETMLNGLIRSGFSILGTWPMRTERTTRMVSQGTNALASSIVLVCRRRPADAPLATRREFINSLKQELPSALKTLQQSSIAPVDLAQAAIGPGMAVYTRYAKVMEADGSPMTVRTALALINQMLDEVLAEQEGEFDADTRWAIAWFEQFGMNEGPFGTAETLSRAKNTAVNALVEDGLITAKAGKVRLVPRDELAKDWNPATDKRPTVWESTQHLIRALDQNGEAGAADLLRKLGSGMGETARDLAYSLYTICDRKKWPQEAVYYNSLITSWLEIQNLVHTAEHIRKGQQNLGEEDT